MHWKSARRKPAKHKKTSGSQISQQGLTFVSKKEHVESKEEAFWRPKKGYISYKVLLLPSITICLDMEQFVLDPASVYKSSETQTATKQDIPNYQSSQNPTYQTDSIKREIFWCKDLGYVDELVKDKNGVKYLLVRQDLFDWAVDAKTKKTRSSKKRSAHFWHSLQKRIDPQ